MAVAGQPIAGRHLFALWSAQVSQGTAVTPATSMGIVDFDVTSDTDLRTIYNIGSPNAKFFKPGILTVPFQVPIRAFQTSAFLLKAQRSSGVLPWVTLGFGYVLDDASVYGWQVQDCKLGNFEVSLDAGGILSGSVGGVGGLITDLSAGAMAHLSQTPMMSYEAVLTKGGSAWEAKTFRLSVNHNVTVDSVIPGTAPSTFKRGWSYQTEGNISISGEIGRFAKSGVNLQAATLTDFALVLTMTDIAGGMSPNVISLTFANAEFGSEKFAGTVDGEAMFTTPFVAQTLTVA